jgi:hypothetical protein
MRRILVENARHKRSQKAGHGRERRPLDDLEATVGAPPDDLLALDEALTRLGRENQPAAELAKLRLFTGLTVDEAADAMSYLNTAFGQFGVSLSWAATGTAADVTVHFADTTPEGSAADGVLGFTTADNDVYLVEGWDLYTGADPTKVGAGQYEFRRWPSTSWRTRWAWARAATPPRS